MIDASQFTNLDILHLDDDLLIVNKPSGLLSVPGKGPENQHCLHKLALQFNPNARIVHRLDQATSGILMFPLNYPTLKQMTAQFEAREIHKRYVAVVEGLIEDDRGEVKLPLICDWPNRPRQMVCFDTGKAAHTRFNVLSRDTHTNTTRVDLEPVSGRTHQLRVHMLSLGHPILGDRLYAPDDIIAKSPRLLLHAQEIHLSHPITGVPINITCTAPF